MTKQKLTNFQKKIWRFHAENRRDLAWRTTWNPYEILVSEVMLQQTQVKRVAEYYPRFLKSFPDFKSLAKAPLSEVLKLWQGLGYNRRAQALHNCAKVVATKYKGELPSTLDELCALPGIGSYTAAALQAFAWNKDVVVLETNIRTVFLHEFFAQQELVSDKELLPLIEKSLPKKKAREWYYALMDYGVALKRTIPGINKKSKHYTKQSPFKGSDREVRGAILRALSSSAQSLEELETAIKDKRVSLQIEKLSAEKLIVKKKTRYYLGV